MYGWSVDRCCGPRQIRGYQPEYSPVRLPALGVPRLPGAHSSGFAVSACRPSARWFDFRACTTAVAQEDSLLVARLAKLECVQFRSRVCFDEMETDLERRTADIFDVPWSPADAVR